MQNPSHSLCEYLGGHVWSKPLLTEDALGNRVVVVACLDCPSVRCSDMMLAGSNDALMRPDLDRRNRPEDAAPSSRPYVSEILMPDD
jgi:hypothetical protein